MTRYDNSSIDASNYLPTVRLVTNAIIVVCTSASLLFAEVKTDSQGNRVEYTQATMSDGIKIALAVGYPEGFDPGNVTRKWPTVYQMSGYQAATRVAPHEYYDGYVTVTASLRGTGASEGTFSLFSDRSTQDGYEIIEDWIVKQEWSDGKVGIYGHSWPGLTGFRVASTNPPHLRAVVVSGVLDDVGRGLAQIGGIRNVGFPLSWSSNIQRSDGVFGSDEAAAESRGLSESEARKLRESRNTPNLPGTVEQEPTRNRNHKRYVASQRRSAFPFCCMPIRIIKRGRVVPGSSATSRMTLPSACSFLTAITECRFDSLINNCAWFDFWLRGERDDACRTLMIQNHVSRHFLRSKQRGETERSLGLKRFSIG